jgi:hypothetical protein
VFESNPTESSTPTPKAAAGGRKPLATRAPPPQEEIRKPSNSSSALREQIAKAKAARKAQASKRPVDEVGGGAGDFEFDAPADPFNQGGKIGTKALQKRVDMARMDGRLNISAMGLTEIPKEVMNMYEFDPENESIAWGEVVDLVRFVAADNDLETLGDDVFPDLDPYDMDPNDESKGPQFGGLEWLDLHGNLLRTIPLGLRKLGNLTTLNLVSWPLDAK